MKKKGAKMNVECKERRRIIEGMTSEVEAKQSDNRHGFIQTQTQVGGTRQDGTGDKMTLRTWDVGVGENGRERKVRGKVRIRSQLWKHCDEGCLL